MGFSSANVNEAASASWLGSFGNLTSTNPLTPLILNFGTAYRFTGSGSGALQANYVYGNTRTVTDGSPDIIDITTLTNPDGTPCAFTDLVFVGFFNRGTNALEVMTIGGGSSGGATPIVSVWGPGDLPLPIGCIAQFVNPSDTGYAVDATSANSFQVSVASGTNVPYDILLFGH